MIDLVLEVLAVVDSFLWGPWTMAFLAGGRGLLHAALRILPGYRTPVHPLPHAGPTCRRASPGRRTTHDALSGRCDVAGRNGRHGQHGRRGDRALRWGRRSHLLDVGPGLLRHDVEDRRDHAGRVLPRTWPRWPVPRWPSGYDPTGTRLDASRDALQCRHAHQRSLLGVDAAVPYRRPRAYSPATI